MADLRFGFDWYNRETHATPKSVGDAAFAWGRDVWEEQMTRRQLSRVHESLYGNLPLLGRAMPSLTSRRLSLNIVRSMSQTVVAKMFAKTPPKPKFDISGGTYDDKTAAEQCEQGMDGIFYDTAFATRVLPAVGSCTTVYGTGSVLIHDDGKTVKIDAVNPTEWLIKEGEGLYGKPRNLGRTRLVDRAVLSMRYGDVIEARMAIAEAPGVNAEDDGALNDSSDMVRVYELWHLPDDDGKNGRHVICIGGWAFLDKEYEEDEFPVVFIRWTSPLPGLGFWGEGLAFELTGLQLEINKLLQQIQKGHHLITGHWYLNESAKIPTAHINNDLGAIIRFAGVRPDYVAPSIIAPEVYQHLWNLVQRSYEIAGISQLSSGALLPGKDMSGAAIDNFHDIESERFMTLGRDIEEFTCQVAMKAAIAAKRVKMKTRTLVDGKLIAIDWGTIEADLRTSRVQVYPASSIPSTYSGKLQWANQMAKWIPDDDMLDILGIPDVEGTQNRLLAPRRIIERNLNAIVKGDEYMPPEPLDDHKLALRLASQMYSMARLDGLDEGRLDLLRQYAETTKDFLAAAAPPPPPPPMPGAPPPGPPMPLPPAPVGP